MSSRVTSLPRDWERSLLTRLTLLIRSHWCTGIRIVLDLSLIALEIDCLIYQVA